MADNQGQQIQRPDSNSQNGGKNGRNDKDDRSSSTLDQHPHQVSSFQPAGVVHPEHFDGVRPRQEIQHPASSEELLHVGNESSSPRSSSFPRPRAPLTGDPMKDVPIFPDEPPEDAVKKEVPVYSSVSEVKKRENTVLDAGASSEVIDSEEGEIVSSGIESSLDAIPSPDHDDSSFGGIREKISDLLEEANISIKQLAWYCGGCVIFLILSVFLVRFGFSFFRGIEEESVNDVSDVVSDGSAESQSEAVVEGPDNALIFAFLVGMEEGSVRGYFEPAVSVAILLGTESERFEKRFTQLVEQLKEMKNTVDTDLILYLDQSREREIALDSYLHALEKQEKTGQKNLEEIQNVIELFRTSFENNGSPRDGYEERFFASLRTLSGPESETLLDGFIRISQEQVELKARLRSMEKLSGYYETILRRIRRRLRESEVNYDALVKGVQVIDIEGSDLELIIGQESLGE